ncbi:DUF3306 domain-containing protein [Primorskyibacter sp. 2E107]|uniref:DUF3306 domain-containing protein n=1 Tax=Primorskyibacter sp. 2E107 TaxID=3403458 RepID=UPI003AF8F158
MSGFWGKRKAAVEAEALAERKAEAEREKQQADAALAERPDEALLAELGLPDPDTVTDPDMIKKFLTDALPERLRRRALRRLWGLNPVLANLDGLVDYDDDFTDAAVAVPNLKTTYQVGKGLLAHVLDAEEKARQSALTMGDDPAEPEPDTEPPEDAEPESVQSVAETSAPAVSEDRTAMAQPSGSEGDTADAQPASARRMRFRFDPEV